MSHSRRKRAINGRLMTLLSKIQELDDMDLTGFEAPVNLEGLKGELMDCITHNETAEESK